MTDLGLAEQAARRAGELLLRRFGAPEEAVASKSSATDMVSEADHEAERSIVEALTNGRPADGILGEEGAHVEGSSGRRWIVDPLDGTTNFLFGHPAWAVSIALEDDKGRSVGVVHAPVLGETYIAERGGGCMLNGADVSVREPTVLASALLATGFSYVADERRRQADELVRILPRVRDVRRGGAAALDLAWVAAGRLDGYWERGVKLWDWAAGALLVTEAGGAIRLLTGPDGLMASSPALLPDLIDLVG